MINFSGYHPSQFRRWAMPRLNFWKRKQNRITGRITERLRLQSQITTESHYQFGDLSYTAIEPGWQLTIDMMKSSTEQPIFKEGDSRVYTIKSYRQVEGHREEVYRDTEKWTVMSTEKTTKILLTWPIERATMQSTGWSPKRTSNDDYQVKANCR
jgi:hypothetical protein